jgi:hypothetical protein
MCINHFVIGCSCAAVYVCVRYAGADPGISGGGDDMDEEKIGRGLGAAVGPQRGPGAEPLVGVKGAKPPTKVTLFSRIIQ